MPIDLPSARRQLNGLRQMTESGLATEELEDAHYYLRDIQAYTNNLERFIQPSADETIEQDPDPTRREPRDEAFEEAPSTGAGQSSAYRDDAAEVERQRLAMLEAMRDSTVAREPRWVTQTSTSTPQGFGFADASTLHQPLTFRIQSTPDGSVYYEQVDAASVDEPVQPGGEG